MQNMSLQKMAVKLGFLPLVVGVLFFLFLMVRVVPAGHVGAKDFFGKVSDKALKPGMHLVMPMTRVIKMNVRTVEDKEVASVPSSEGLIVKLDVSFLYRVDPERAVEIYKTIGRNYERVVVTPQLRSVIRDATAGYEAKFLYSTAREEVAQKMLSAVKLLLSPRGIIAEQVLLRSIELPRLLTGSIEEKLQAEQQSQRMKFVLAKEEQEADRKRVEAKGIEDFQRIVARGLTGNYLKWKGIEAVNEIAKSSNSKVVILGDKSGLPIILNTQ